MVLLLDAWLLLLLLWGALLLPLYVAALECVYVAVGSSKRLMSDSNESIALELELEPEIFAFVVGFEVLLL